MFTINLQSREPIYEQLYSNILRLISIGVLKPGDKLPPVRQLASEHGINPNTVAKSYQLLERDGVTYSLVGKGSFVSPDVSSVAAKKKLASEKFTESLQKAVSAGLSKKDIWDIVEKLFCKEEEH